MEGSQFNLAQPSAADLSKAPAFDLGPLRVEPSTRLLSAGAASETLEPRAMRVLVALGETPGLVLSRDDLIELCWDGQIVGDAAVNRAIALVRHALNAIGGGAVVLETITKVGFRIVVRQAEAEAEAEARDPEDAPEPPKRAWSKRALIAGLAATGAGAALAYGLWIRPARNAPDPRARDLLQRGQFLIETGEAGTARQAIDFYKQALAIDPDYADAWGALAVGYLHNLDGLAAAARVAAPELSRSAARRALSLDPDQPDAQLALAVPLPHFRRWFDHEQPLRAIVRRYPDYWYGHAQLGMLLYDVGRASEAAERFRRVLELKPMLPNYWLRFAGALNAAGRVQEADLAFDQALARWPTNLFLRENRVWSYLDDKRYGEDIAFLRDTRNYPEQVPRATIERALSIAESLATGTGFAEQIEVLRRWFAQSQNPHFTAWGSALIWFGAVDLAFDALEAGFLGGTMDGRRFAPPAATDRRSTAGLWGKTWLSVSGDPRFGSVLERIGLENYWRKSGTQPDFRKR